MLVLHKPMITIKGELTLHTLRIRSHLGVVSEMIHNLELLTGTTLVGSHHYRQLNPTDNFYAHLFKRVKLVKLNKAAVT
jgi:hypothetical protein